MSQSGIFVIRLGVGRTHFDNRVAITGQSIEEIKEKLKAKDCIRNRIGNQNSPKVAWLYSQARVR